MTGFLLQNKKDGELTEKTIGGDEHSDIKR